MHQHLALGACAFWLFGAAALGTYFAQRTTDERALRRWTTEAAHPETRSVLQLSAPPLGTDEWLLPAGLILVGLSVVGLGSAYCAWKSYHR